MVDRPTPIAPVYPLLEPGAPVPLFEGDLSLGGQSGRGRIWLATHGDVDHLWEFEAESGLPLDLEEAQLSFDHPELGQAVIPALVTSSAGRGTILATSLGDPRDELDEIIIHWINIPSIYPAKALGNDSHTWAGRWTGTGGGWSLTLDARPDHAAVTALAKGTPLYAVTHTGKVTRTDGSRFTAGEATDALHAWQVALSFALGRWVTPALAVGFTAGRRTWETWTSWRCDTYRGSEAWWNTHRADDLRSFATLFLDAWADPARRDRVRYVAHHVIEANEPSMTLEARVMLAGASLEYLSWVVHVLGGRRSATKHRSRSASENLRELLLAARIPVSVAPELDALEQLRAQESLADGPEAVSWVRNRLVHPKDAGEPYRLKHLVLQTWQLVMHYAELLALHDLGYTGSFCQRFPAGRWAHSSSPVPWTP
jgi:hypothetical protein